MALSHVTEDNNKWIKHILQFVGFKRSLYKAKKGKVKRVCDASLQKMSSNILLDKTFTYIVPKWLT